jgi:Holliday junction resolvase
VDERFTTATAHEALRAGGRDSRARRQTVDSAAAAVLLEAALEAERRTGLPPGDLVTCCSGGDNPPEPPGKGLRPAAKHTGTGR